MVHADSLPEAVEAVFGPDAWPYNFRPTARKQWNMATYRLQLTTGGYVFLKEYMSGELDRCQAEADGLQAIRDTGTIGAPEPLAVGLDKALRTSFLLVSFIEPGPAVPNYWETFGRELAALHRADTAGLTGMEDRPYGFRSDNHIGRSPQQNMPMARWADFFREQRLFPQMNRAAHYMDADTRRKCDRLLDRLETYLPEPAFPSLLHGDLWHGNQSRGPDGKAWIYDPAVYVGHYEADLAMTELFGGFHPAFYRGYHSVIPREDGYEDRREIYNLYHLLNHLNLFGSDYLTPVRDILDRYA